jgi:hypothetical protein
MNDRPIAPRRAAKMAPAGALFLLASLGAMAQTTSSGSSGSTSSTSSPSTTSTSSPSSWGSPFNVQSESDPYYLGVSQAFTHDSNVFRTPSGLSDVYSSTSLRAGLDQAISRQRVFATAVVSGNRYKDQKQLNNTSYSLDAGLAWETIEHLSGNLSTSFASGLSSPTAGDVPTTSRNIGKTRNVDAVARWGGVSLLTLEGNAGWSSIDYSAPESAQSESSQTRGGVTLFYSPGGPLRVGVGGRVIRTNSPQAIFDPATGTYQGTRITSKSADLHAGYQVSGFISANGRFGYTTQNSSGIGSDEVSGWTGSLGVSWRPTGKLSVGFDASRDAGYDSSTFSTLQILNNNGVLTLTPVTGIYQNNRVTDSAGISLTHLTTAKTSLFASARYSRGAVISSGTIGGTASPEAIDTGKYASLGGNWEITRYWSAACSLTQEWRDVSGTNAFTYTARLATCSTQLTLR